jgi:glycosyltransferase involved in cell wall biosynthesis
MGQPTKVLDYMTCGKATVVTPWAVWGIPRLQDGYNTLVAYDECEFVAKTLELLEDPGKALRIGMAARETVVAAYSWDVWAEKLEQALELALARY